LNLTKGIRKQIFFFSKNLKSFCKKLEIKYQKSYIKPQKKPTPFQTPARPPVASDNYCHQNSIVFLRITVQKTSGKNLIICALEKIIRKNPKINI
jgi:hypothetical protein